MKKISVCCCTYNRPGMLGELIQSYMIQNYPPELRELVILDDGGQYGDVRGDGWRIVSIPQRFASLGEKRNACVALASRESEWIVIADDDDIYLPHWLECHARNLARGVSWSFASRVYYSVGNKIKKTWKHPKSGWFVHPTCAFSKELFERMGGYPPLAWREDHFFFEKMRKEKIKAVDSLCDEDSPFMIFRRKENPKHRHTTRMSLKTYQTDFCEPLPPTKVEIGWKRDYMHDIIEYEKNR